MTRINIGRDHNVVCMVVESPVDEKKYIFDCGSYGTTNDIFNIPLDEFVVESEGNDRYIVTSSVTGLSKKGYYIPGVGIAPGIAIEYKNVQYCSWGNVILTCDDDKQRLVVLNEDGSIVESSLGVSNKICFFADDNGEYIAKVQNGEIQVFCLSNNKGEFSDRNCVFKIKGDEIFVFNLEKTKDMYFEEGHGYENNYLVVVRDGKTF